MMPNDNKLWTEETCQFPVYLASATSRALDNENSLTLPSTFIQGYDWT
jgi:hypothetical protein